MFSFEASGSILSQNSKHVVITQKFRQKKNYSLSFSALNFTVP